MAFGQNKVTRSKNQFAARMVSAKTGATIGWFHPTDDFARKVCGVQNVTDITAEMATAKLPALLDNGRSVVSITDMTAPLEVVAVEAY